MEDNMHNSMTLGESRKLDKLMSLIAVCSKKIKNKSSVPKLRHVQQFKNKAGGYINRVTMEDDMDNPMTQAESRKLDTLMS